MEEEEQELMQITDANEAVASVAFRLAEMVIIYPITPSSPMAEFCDEWAAANKKNLWGESPDITEMQSEAGVAGAVHGALQCGSLVTTFTASQGLLLMIPNLHKIAGQLLPFCMHVTARALASHALSIFGDHSDVMACRGTGFALFVSNSVQEAHDFAAIATAVTYESRVPFLHFFDGFRTSHEVNTYAMIPDSVLRELLNPLALEAFRLRSMDPNSPTIRGTAQNPDVFFQGRERCNTFHDAVPQILQRTMEKFSRATGRSYAPYEYAGAAAAETVFVCMGSGAETIEETIGDLNGGKGKKMGLVKVRLYRPFSAELFAARLPKTTKTLIVLDRTKEPGSLGEPLYLDVVGALAEARAAGWLPANFLPSVHGGRYGLGSKEFSPAMVKGIADASSAKKLRLHFTVGIDDDVTHLSVPYEKNYRLPEEAGRFNALFYGLGADGTVGANKNTIKIIGHETGNYAQAYFVYDSKKSGGMTVSHLRFGPEPIRAPYLIEVAQFIGCHQFQFLEKFDLLRSAAPGGVFLLNAPHGPRDIQDHLGRSTAEQILRLGLQFYVIDAYAVAQGSDMGRRINTIMQTCFFAISGILPRDTAIAAIKKSIEKTYAKKGQAVVEKNFSCVDQTLANLHRVELDAGKVSGTVPDRCHCRCPNIPQFVKDVTIPLLEGRGEELSVGALPVDGTWPTDTVCYEKRNVAQEVPRWDPALCIQCNRCALFCPHAAIRSKFYPASALAGAPEQFLSTDFRSRDNPDCKFTVQVAPEDCTGCGLCVEACLGKSRTEEGKKALCLVPRTEVVGKEKENYRFFRQIPQPPAEKISNDVKGSQFLQPLFEFSGACAGCGETPYVKLLTQLFGDHLIIANATGCSSIYGGNLPTTPYCKDERGRGPSWANSLFEDNAEFGLGMLLAVERRRKSAEILLRAHGGEIGEKFVGEILNADQSTRLGIELQRTRLAELKKLLLRSQKEALVGLLPILDQLAKKSVWVIGGDGWAYDIGFGGLDHAIASGKNIKILVLDTEVYSNTGGQQSKSTPIGAIAKFAAAGKSSGKKDLGRIAMTYGHVYVAQVALGAKDTQTVDAFLEAESYDGPALIIAYCPCIAHGFEMREQLDHQKQAVAAGYWQLYRYDPRRAAAGGNPLQLDSKAATEDVATFMATENRFSQLARTDQGRAETLTAAARDQLARRRKIYEEMESSGGGKEGPH
ncbi:MAG: pyruvate:ferredoxin (flavodoxin) oxidoreductase [Puniceicoccales bacterium]|jgi:pyruvate-ferredoxin/flavodoxin oxidoreductase|nr:pyruvate:ferredoxin (flavodoxin) oxidoreductase [Puniceicoccales bacterium]